jgi:hypothetical protein
VALLIRPAIAGLLLGLASARVGGAHVVPIPPSVCSFGPLTLQVPGTPVDGAGVGAPGKLRITYDANASEISACALGGGGSDCGAGVPTPFVLGGIAGSLVLPARFGGVMTSNGDVFVDPVPVTVSVGGVASTVPVAFTTGLVAAHGDVVEGSRLHGLDGWVLVGVVDGAALPSPLDGASLVLTVPCVPRPVPDRDQFGPPSAAGPLRGRIARETTRLRTAVTVGQADRPSFARRATMIVLRVDGSPIAQAVLSGGLHGRARLVGTSDDGLTTVTVSARTARRFAVDLRMRDAALPRLAPGARALVELTIDAGGVLARGETLFHATRSGDALRR